MRLAALAGIVLFGTVACLDGPEVTTIGDEEQPAPRVQVAEGSEPAADAAGGSPVTTEKPTAATTAEPTTTETTVVETTTTTTEPDSGTTTTDTTEEVPGTTAPGRPGHADQSVTFVNQKRSEAGLQGLEVDPELTALADAWARQMAAEQELYHNPNLGEQMPGHYMAWGENVAYNSDPTGIDQAWWNSDGHRANIVNSSYTHIGVAFVADDQGTHWAVQVFAG